MVLPITIAIVVKEHCHPPIAKLAFNGAQPGKLIGSWAAEMQEPSFIVTAVTDSGMEKKLHLTAARLPGTMLRVAGVYVYFSKNDSTHNCPKSGTLHR